jgi:predicted HicB family RNase H-like nuclease
MARPRLYDEPRIATAVRLPSDLHERLRLEAMRRQVSANLLVERAIAIYLDRLPPLADEA